MKYLKGYPAQVPVALRCLLAAQDTLPLSKRWSQLIECLTAKLPGEATSGQANVENLIHAQTLPTLRTLGFVVGEDWNTRLTTRGWSIARLSPDDKQMKLTMGAMLLDRDNDTWRFIPILEGLRSYPGEATPIYDLAIGIAKRGMDPRQKFEKIPAEKRAELDRLGATTSQGSRLSETLKYYDYTDLVRRAGGTLTLLDSTVQRAASVFGEMIRREVDQDDFFHTLKTRYSKYVRILGSPYVPVIPYLRDSVCRDLRIDEDTFSAILGRLVPSYQGYRLLLSPPSERKHNTELVTVGGRQFYYLSMYGRGSAGSAA